MKYVRRFSRTERTLHWVNAAGFLLLLATGLILYLPRLSVLVGRRPLIKDVHLWGGIGWISALVIVIALGDRRGLLRTAHDIEVLRPSRLNVGQKVNAILTAVFALMFALTGFFLWYGERNTRFRFAQTILIHDWLMYVSFFLFIGHLYLSLIHPKTRHALNGITRGWVDEDWARAHHAKWAAQAARED